MVENQTDFIFDEKPIVDTCRKAMQRRRDYFGSRFIVYLGRVPSRKGFVKTFEVFDKKTMFYIM